MKQKLLYKYLIIIICACAWSGQAWGATGYVLAQDSSNDGEMWELTTSDPLALSGPGDKMIFEACKARTGVDGLYVEFSEDGNDWFDSGQGEIDVPANGRKSVGFLQYETVWKWKEFTIPINNLNVRYVRFRLKFGSTLNKYWRNVRVTRATTLGINTLPEDPVDFETVHRGSSRSKNVSVDYNNNSYNQDLTLSYKEGSTSSSIVTIPTTSMGETSYTGTGTSCTSTNPKIVSVTFSPTSTTALGSHSGTVTLSMNGATATFNTTANVVTTYYASSSVTAVPAAGGSAYTSFTTPNPTSGTTATKNSGDVSTANATTNVYFNAVANSNYVFKGWTAATATSYSGVTPVTSLTYKSENSSSPTSIAYKAWFAPLCNFSVTASVGNAGGGTAKVSVGNTILENATGTATANDVEGTPGTSSATQTFTFSATPSPGYEFVGWATTPSATAADVLPEAGAQYTPTFTSNTPATTYETGLYAIFRKKTLTLNPASPSYEAGLYAGTVTLQRTLPAGYSTIALPFATTVAAIVGESYNSTNDWVAQLKTVTHTQADAGSNDEYTLYFLKVDGGSTIAANQPYVLHLGSQVVNPTWENLTVAAIPDTPTASNLILTGYSGCSTDWAMYANYDPVFSMDGKYGIVNSQGGLMLGSGSDAKLKAFTAYITGPGSSNPNQAPRLRVAYVDTDGTTTYIDSSMAENPSSGPTAIYGPDGKHRSRLQPGLNIVHQADGTTRKVMY